MKDGKYRWLLEQEIDGEVSAFPEATEPGISQALDTKYAALYDTADESCIWCVGEPDRRIIEIRTFDVEGVPFYGVVSVHNTETQQNTTVDAIGNVVNVPSNEVLTRDQAESIFRAFFHNKFVPSGFCVLPKSYLFGPST
jgi:hypothetical protein